MEILILIAPLYSFMEYTVVVVTCCWKQYDVDWLKYAMLSLNFTPLLQQIEILCVLSMF